jgi:hypothetical protein
MANCTKFRIYLQPPYVPGFEQPFLVKVETRDDEPVEPGPADRLFYVLDARNKPGYPAEGPHNFQPFRGRPWKGKINRIIASPNWDGHFDHLKPDDLAFPAASIYATARLTLNFWNRIFKEAGVPELTEWHHNPEQVVDKPAQKDEKPATMFADPSFAARLELIPRCISAGSRAGYGFVEVGRDNPVHKYYDRYAQSEGGSAPASYQRGAMWQNFDVIAHEVGHAILFKVIGFPQSATKIDQWFSIPEPEFLIFHESMADLMAILSLLDLEPFLGYLVRNSEGLSVLAGIGELQRLSSPGFLPIRSAYNDAKYPNRKAREAYKNEEAHMNSLALTGAVFDILLKLYSWQDNAKAAPTTVAEAMERVATVRDIVAGALASLWSTPEDMWTDPDNRSGFSIVKVAECLPKHVGTAAATAYSSSEATKSDKPPKVYNAVVQLAARCLASHDLPFGKDDLKRSEETKPPE